MAITPGKPQWVYATTILLVVVPILSALAFSDRIHDWYLTEYRGPGLQRQFGFTVGKEKVVENNEAYDVFVVQAVQPGGSFEKAGFQAGDIPFGYKHGFESGFYQDLLWAQAGNRVDIRVVKLEDARKGKWATRITSLNLSRVK